MKPVLNILGRKRNIVAVVVRDEQGNDEHIYDHEEFNFMDENVKADLSTAIENLSHSELYIERLLNTIKESHDYLHDLKMQISDTVIENHNLPVPGANVHSIVEEIKGQVSFIEGLELSLDIAKGGKSWDVNKVIEESSTE